MPGSRRRGARPQPALTYHCATANQTPSLPAYVVSPCALTTYYEMIAGPDQPQTKIFAFGSAHEVGRLPLSFQCAVEACSPEIVFARVVEEIANPPVEPPDDVWALGATIYEIIAGSSHFYGVGMTSLPSHMSALAGSVSPGWQRWWARLSDPPEISSDHADAWWASRREALSRGCPDDADTDALVELLKNMLVLDPTVRPMATEVLQHPWFGGSG